jgi:glycosyltransferase involved in cell wall biosynthesis
MDDKRIKIIHVINCLSPGGAERMLFNLLANADMDKFDIKVLSLQDKGQLYSDIKKLGVPVYCFSMFHKIDFIFKFIKLIYTIHKLKPDIIHTWMYHSNIIAGFAAKIVSRCKIVWSIHASKLDAGFTKRSTKIAIKLSSLMSFFIPHKIIFCSNSSYYLHQIIGFDNSKMAVVPNGVDLKLFKKSNANKLELINKINNEDNTIFIGMAARYDPMKGYDIFIRSAKILCEKYSNVHFLLCGSNVTNSNHELVKMIIDDNLVSRIHLLGYISDMPKFYNSINILTVASSYGEAFPMSICEAMSCEVPVVSSDLGDCSYIINDSEMIFPINNAEILSKRWEKIITHDKEIKHMIGKKNRERIMSLFEIKNIEKTYEKNYLEVLNNN